MSARFHPDRHKTPHAWLSIGCQTLGVQNLIEEPALDENIRDGARAVIPTIFEKAMPSSPYVGFALEKIASLQHFMNRSRESAQSKRHAALQHNCRKRFGNVSGIACMPAG